MLRDREPPMTATERARLLARLECVRWSDLIGTSDSGLDDESERALDGFVAELLEEALEGGPFGEVGS
jgi:hypothetical protein